MKQKNKISILINVSLSKVFEFTINPNNTHLWIDSVVEEKIDKFPIKLGTEYKNVNQKGEWTEYIVVKFETDKIFELKEKEGDYSVRYEYKEISPKETELTYFEWVEKGELKNLFLISTLEKLKEVLESII